jgi:hypothetical protein
MRSVNDPPDHQNLRSREAAFGLWKGQTAHLPGETEPLPEDGLNYQELLRAEWDEDIRE